MNISRTLATILSIGLSAALAGALQSGCKKATQKSAKKTDQPARGGLQSDMGRPLTRPTRRGWARIATKKLKYRRPLTSVIDIDERRGIVSDPMVAVDAHGNFVVVWSAQLRGQKTWQVLGQRFDERGVKQGGLFVVSGKHDDLPDPEVGMDAKGRFVVVWTPGDGIFMQRFDAQGRKQGAQVKVAAKGAQPAIAMTPKGRFVVAWADERLLAQRFDAAGKPDGVRIEVTLIGKTLGGEGGGIVAAMEPGGRFVIAWRQNGIKARVYDDKGQPQVRLIWVSNADRPPAVAMRPGGEFLVAWGDTNIRFQRYDAQGKKIGKRASAGSSEGNGDPTVVMDRKGQFMIIWQSSGVAKFQAGDYAERFFYVRRYDAQGKPKEEPDRFHGGFGHDPTQRKSEPRAAITPYGRVVVAFRRRGTQGEDLHTVARVICEPLPPPPKKSLHRRVAPWGPGAQPGPQGPHASLCSKSRWCWRNPLPHGVPLFGVTVSGPRNVWAVGKNGTILRFDGKAWSQVPSHGNNNVICDLNAVWRTGPKDAWAVGGVSTITHFDGVSWKQIDKVPKRNDRGNNTLYGVWASGPNDVWVVGEIGTILRYDGRKWSLVAAMTTENTLRGVWGSGPKDVWAVGERGTILRYDGKRWSTVVNPVSPTGERLNGVWGSGPKDVWAVGHKGVILRWNGTAWRRVSSPATENLRAVWGRGPKDVWAVGDDGVSLRWNGRTWSVVPTRIAGQLRAVWGVGPKEVWAVGEGGTTLRWNGSAWTCLSSGFLLGEIKGMYGVGSNLWVVGDRGVIRWNGKQWSLDFKGETYLKAVHGSGPRNILAIGSWGKYLHYDGRAWKAVPGPKKVSLRDMWTGGPKDAWAVGEKGTILRWDGARWSSAPSGTKVLLRGIWGSGPQHVWAVGDKGTLLRYDGTAWKAVRSPTREKLHDIWGSSKQDVWVAGDKGIVLRYDGKRWSKVTVGTEFTTIIRVSGSGPKDVWALGYVDSFHWDGTRWSKRGVFKNTFLVDFWVRGPKDVWGIQQHAVLQYRP
ncbi:MAG: hypothetical protein ABI333_01090 [bacterium]